MSQIWDTESQIWDTESQKWVTQSQEWDTESQIWDTDPPQPIEVQGFEESLRSITDLSQGSFTDQIKESGAIADANAPHAQSRSGKSEPKTGQSHPVATKKTATVKTQKPAPGKDADPKNSKERKKPRLEDMAAEQVYALLPYRERYEKFWVWYCKKCGESVDSKGKTPNPGDKKLAAIAWMEMEIDSILEEFREGCAVFNWKGVGIPNFHVFIRGNRTDGKEPYWRAALEQHKARQQQADESIVPDSTGETSFYCSPLEQWAQYENPAEPIDMGGQLAAIKVYWRAHGITWKDERLIQWFERSGIEYNPETARFDRFTDLTICKLAYDLQKTFVGGV